MGDLGIHALHLPLRAGWEPVNVRAILSDIVTERPDGRGGTVPCDTWDNAVLLCEVEDEGHAFPLRVETKRIAPGQTNTWTVEIDGTDGSIAYTTKYPKTLRWMEYRSGGPQAWQTDRPRLRLGVSARHRRDLRVRVLGRDPPDVGSVPRRARARKGRDAPAFPLRHPRGGGRHAPALHGSARVAARPVRRRALRATCMGCCRLESPTMRRTTVRGGPRPDAGEVRAAGSPTASRPGRSR